MLGYVCTQHASLRESFFRLCLVHNSSSVNLFNKSITIFHSLYSPWSLCVVKYSEDKQRSLLRIAAWSIFLMAPLPFKNLLSNLSRLFLFSYLQFSSRVQRPTVIVINIGFGVSISFIDKMVQIKFLSEVVCGLHLIAHRKILVAHWAFKALKILINIWYPRQKELDAISSDGRKCTNISRNTIVPARIRKSWALITVKISRSLYSGWEDSGQKRF